MWVELRNGNLHPIKPTDVISIDKEKSAGKSGTYAVYLTVGGASVFSEPGYSEEDADRIVTNFVMFLRHQTAHVILRKDLLDLGQF